jgi:cell division topological specificity factor
LFEVIRKYVNVDPEAIQVNLEKEDGHDVLELSVALPEKSVATG